MLAGGITPFNAQKAAEQGCLGWTLTLLRYPRVKTRKTGSIFKQLEIIKNIIA